MAGIWVLVLVASVAHAMPVTTETDTAKCDSSCYALCNFDLSLESDRTEYIAKTLEFDGVFASPAAGLVEKLGITLDHCYIDAQTGATIPGSCCNFTAASKESLHVGMLAHVVARTRGIAWRFMAGAKNEEEAIEMAVDVMDKKITTYERFRETAPGYGGMIPWIFFNEDGLAGYLKKGSSVPSLDNGQLAWSLYVAADVLAKAGFQELGDRYKRHFDVMVSSMKTLFYDKKKTGGFYTVVLIKDPSQPVSPDNVEPSDGNTLNDPYEGELFMFLADLFAQWESEEERDRQWMQARPDLVAVNYTHANLPEPITVQRGWRFSSHEQWKLMMLPYRDLEIARRVFDNCERARTYDAVLKGVPGLKASCYSNLHDYVDSFGIPEISMGFTPYKETVTTPYGAFPVILANEEVGLRWHKLMLDADYMQGPMGSTESRNEATGITSLLMTWDSKVTTDLAMLGGINDLVRPLLKRDGKLDRFYFVVNRELQRVFNSTGSSFLSGEDLPFAVPPFVSQRPRTFATCSTQAKEQKIELLSTVAEPVFSPSYGSYYGPVNVTISVASANAVIMYTTDGITPTQFYGSVYSAPINVSNLGQNLLQAIAVVNGNQISNVASALIVISGEI